tara:strand:- start:1518 stop:2189 length:672 start_codon:yes stop_codon:yes gene_type:complete
MPTSIRNHNPFHSNFNYYRTFVEICSGISKRKLRPLKTSIQIKLAGVSNGIGIENLTEGGAVAKRIRDSQKNKVYNWENKNLPYIGEQLSLEQCKQLIHQAIVWWFRNPKPQMPLIKHGKGTTIARGGAMTINLPRWARNYGVVLHETTHCLIERMKHNDVDGGHGPYFMRTYIELLGYFLKMDKAELVKRAKSDKIQVIALKYVKRSKKKESILRAIYRKIA